MNHNPYSKIETKVTMSNPNENKAAPIAEGSGLYSISQNASTYSPLNIHTANRQSVGIDYWTADVTGFEPTELDPPRYEFKELNENILTLEHKDPEKYLGMASKYTRKYGHRFWAEFFAILQPIFDFCFALILETLSFLLRLITHLILGFMVRFSDLLIKPILVYVFNSFCLPCLTYSNSFNKAVARVVDPILGIAAKCAEIVSIPLRALRLVDVRLNREINATATKAPFSA